MVTSPSLRRRTNSSQVSSGVGMATEFARSDTIHHSRTNPYSETTISRACLIMRWCLLFLS